MIKCLILLTLLSAASLYAQQPTSSARARDRVQQVAITFDDLPEHGELPPSETRLKVAQSILATIQREHLAPVYGFINAVSLEDDPTLIDVLKTWRAAGQPLGNHTYTHTGLNKQTAAQFEADIQKNEPILASLAKDSKSGADWHYLRYPYLWEGETLEKRHAVRDWLTANNYKIAQVTMHFDDYLWNDPYARCSALNDQPSIAWLEKTYLAAAAQDIDLARQTSQTLYHRDIPYVLLLHIGAFDARMFPQLIQLFRTRGFTFISLPEAQQGAAYAHDPNQALETGGTLQQQEYAARHLSYPHDPRPTKELDTICRTK